MKVLPSFGSSCAVLLACLLAAPGFAGDPPASLRDVLTPAEFQKAGLQKLTPEELQFLSQRILGTAEATGPSPQPPEPIPAAHAETPPVSPVAPLHHVTPATADEFGNEARLRAAADQRSPKKIVSTIPGAFHGWSGHTIFRLENGQLWQQIDDSQFTVSLQDAAVTIEKGALGTFYLRIDGYGTRVKVKRLR